MEETSMLYCQTRQSGHRDQSGSSNTTMLRSSMAHVRWLYRQLRRDGSSAADARMSLVFALHAGQRDMRARVENVVRGI